uniref:Uncharacterized protein n=1 Tax=Iconisemion striatum TaxID=60296 RepID=A0A1A7Y7I3_9TELE
MLESSIVGQKHWILSNKTAGFRFIVAGGQKKEKKRPGGNKTPHPLTAMRPRSRLLTKGRNMLPTIREGTEETVKDVNTFQFGDSSQGVSSEDYLLSICHLARPTFPNRDAASQNICTQQQDAVQQRLKSSRFIGTTLTSSEVKLKEEQCVDMQQEDKKELNGFCNYDPLEFLYGNQNNLFALSGSVRKAFVDGRFVRQHRSVRSNSIPHVSGPDFSCQHKSSCPEILPSVPNVSRKHNSSRLEARRVCPGAEGDRLNPGLKQSFISQWISDCRSAWREARLRACMLPAIAEV